MGLRFRRSLTIIPGVRLNLSNGGASLSLGPRGASINVGKRGTYADIDLPGSGLSYRRRLDVPMGGSSGPSVEKVQIACSIALEGDLIEINRDDGKDVDAPLRAKILRQNTDAIQAMLTAAATERNTAERADELPRIGTTGSDTDGKPVQGGTESREDYMGRLGAWRAACANDVEGRLVAALEDIEWGHQTDIECGLERDRVSLRIDLPIVDAAGEWRPAPRGQPPGLVRRALAQNEINRRYARTCARIARVAIDAVMTRLPEITSIVLHAQSDSDGRLDNLIVADIGRVAWQGARSETDDEMFIARIGGAMQQNASVVSAG